MRWVGAIRANDSLYLTNLFCRPPKARLCDAALWFGGALVLGALIGVGGTLLFRVVSR